MVAHYKVQSFFPFAMFAITIVTQRAQSQLRPSSDSTRTMGRSMWVQSIAAFLMGADSLHTPSIPTLLELTRLPEESENAAQL